jgi:hypothetical protein
VYGIIHRPTPDILWQTPHGDLPNLPEILDYQARLLYKFIFYNQE